MSGAVGVVGRLTDDAVVEDAPGVLDVKSA
jgi:hypothetical protein